MPQSPLRLIKSCCEFIAQEQYSDVPVRTRGIYVLYYRRRRKSKEGPARHRKRIDKFDVVYVGMAKAGRQSGIRGRLAAHRRRKLDLWTHFSFFEVWDNIRDEEIAELEGLFRHIYRHDQRANRLNKQRGYKPLKRMSRGSAKAGRAK